MADHAGDIGAERVDADDGIRCLAADNGQGQAQALHLFGFRSRLGIRTRGTGAHVDDGASLVEYLVYSPGNIVLGLLTTVGIERVGRDIQDAHHLRLVEREQSSVAIQRIIHN